MSKDFIIEIKYIDDSKEPFEEYSYMFNVYEEDIHKLMERVNNYILDEYYYKEIT